MTDLGTSGGGQIEFLGHGHAIMCPDHDFSEGAATWLDFGILGR